MALAKRLVISSLRNAKTTLNLQHTQNILRAQQVYPSLLLSTKLCSLHRCMTWSLNNSAIDRQYSTEASNVKQNFISRMLSKVGVQTLRQPKYILKRSGLRIYFCCSDLIDQTKFIEELNLPDTFNSYFRVLELHVWLALVRLSQEGNEGKILKEHLVEYLWSDLDEKMKKLEGIDSTRRLEGIEIFYEQFRAALISYDEGMMSDDKALAGVVWRTFFEKKYDDVEKIDLMVEYIRKQLRHMDTLDGEVILKTGLVSFLPLYGTEVDIEETRSKLKQICKKINF